MTISHEYSRSFQPKDQVVLLAGEAGLYGRGLSRNLEACEGVSNEIRSKGFKAVAEVFDQGDESSIVALLDALDLHALDGGDILDQPRQRTRPWGNCDVLG